MGRQGALPAVGFKAFRKARGFFQRPHDLPYRNIVGGFAKADTSAPAPLGIQQVVATQQIHNLAQMIAGRFAFFSNLGRWDDAIWVQGAKH